MSGVETLGTTALVDCPVEVVLVAGPAEVDGVGLGALARWVSVRYVDISFYYWVSFFYFSVGEKDGQSISCGVPLQSISG